MVERSRRLEDLPIPVWFRYDGVAGLSREVRQRLGEIQPETIGQAGRYSWRDARCCRRNRRARGACLAQGVNASVTSRAFQDRLLKRARKAGCSLNPVVAGQLEQYFSLLTRWNAKINLTAFNLREPRDEAFDRLLIEPIVAAQHVPLNATECH